MARVAMAWVSLCLVAVVHAQETSTPFRIGFARDLFSDINTADAKASIKVWAQTIAREHDINMDPSAQLFENVEQMIAAMSAGEVDALSTTFPDYLNLSKAVDVDRWFLTAMDDSLYEEYVLLTRTDRNIADADALKDCSLVVHSAARACLAMDWMAHLMIKQGTAGGVDALFPVSPWHRWKHVELPVQNHGVALSFKFQVAEC